MFLTEENKTLANGSKPFVEPPMMYTADKNNILSDNERMYLEQ